jgi:hypothetical protein
VSYKVFNKTYQPIKLIGRTILERKHIIVDELTFQMENLEKKGLLLIKKVK